MKMNILADQYLYNVAEMVPNGAELELYNPDEGLPPHAAEFDALLIRTISKINPVTLPRAGKLKFIGTATAGFDHVDVPHLEQLGIEFARAEGCNANAVAEYIITVLFHWADVFGTDLAEKKIGIIGMGNTGGRVAGYLEKLGIPFAGYDPPKQLREPGFVSCSTEELLACDVLTFHTPLTHSGAFPTFHLCNKHWFEHEFDLVMNAARGGIVDEKALKKAMKKGKVSHYILDVWENEPLFSDEIAKEAFIATPHIAGYSSQAKWQATAMVVEKLCDFFDVKKPAATLEPNLPARAIVPEQPTSFAGFLWENHIIDVYDSELRKIVGKQPAEKKEMFLTLRAETETRIEFGALISQMKNKEELPRQTGIFL